MKDFADLVREPYAGHAKSREEIAATTRGAIPRPADYEYGKRLPEWDASCSLSAEFLVRLEPLSDRIIVRFVNEPQAEAGRIILTDRKELISGDLRKVVVLKVGPGRWVPGEWWKIPKRMFATGGIPISSAASIAKEYEWRWFPGYRRQISVSPGQTVFIGNWVDLEVEDVAICQEGDVRGIAA